MSRNGSGIQSSPAADYPAVASTLIESTKFNNVIDDINTAITGSIAADGQTTITANIPMNSKKFTGVLDGSARTDSISLGQVQDGKLNWVAGGGTADAITATYSPAITALVDGQICFVRATAANATTTPTFAPNGLTARTIVKKGGVALVTGDIEGVGHELILRYLLASTRWELLNPASGSFTGAISGTTISGTTISGTQLTSTVATGTAPLVVSSTTEVANLKAATATTANALAATASTKLPTITATVASNALTIDVSAVYLDFRSNTLTSGTITTILADPAALVISSGSTLGTTSAVQSRLAVLAINNAGTVELAVSNLAGGVDLSETGVISTTAEGGAGAADSATVVYSTTARTNVAYRVIGYVESTQATAGTWATAPSTIQGAGGQALTAMSSLGYGQTWQDLTASRSASTTYYNTTGRTITAFIYGGGDPTGFSITGIVNGVNFTGISLAATGLSGSGSAITLIIPPGGTYSCSFGAGSKQAWNELR